MSNLGKKIDAIFFQFFISLGYLFHGSFMGVQPCVHKGDLILMVNWPFTDIRIIRVVKFRLQCDKLSKYLRLFAYLECQFCRYYFLRWANSNGWKIDIAKGVMRVINTIDNGRGNDFGYQRKNHV